MMQIDYSNIDNLRKVAKCLIESAGDKKIWLFYGEMGVGKTTLISIIAKELGFEGEANSPTFSIVNEYPLINDTKIFHFDFYRINYLDEVIDIGFEDYLSQENCFCFIEWPEIAESILKEYETVILRLQQNEDGNRQVMVYV